MRAAAQSLIKFNFSLLCAVSAQTRPHQHLLTRASAHPDRKMVRHYPKPLQYDATEKQTASIIIIHGLGDTGDGWASFGPEFSQGKLRWQASFDTPLIANKQKIAILKQQTRSISQPPTAFLLCDCICGTHNKGSIMPAFWKIPPLQCGIHKLKWSVVC